MNMTVSTWQKCLFLFKFIRFPKQIGSVTPSSKALELDRKNPIPVSADDEMITKMCLNDGNGINLGMGLPLAK